MKSLAQRLWIGQLLAQLSDRMVSLGLIWSIQQNFGSQWVTWYLVFGGLPHLIFSLVNARLIAKWGSLKVVLWSDWGRSLLFLLAGILLSHFATKDQPGDQNMEQLVWIFFVVFLSNTFAAFFNPAIYTLPAEVSHDSEAQKITAQLSTISSFANVLGPILGILVYQKMGTQILFAIPCFAYFISGALLWKLRGLTKPQPQDSQPFLGPLLKPLQGHKLLGILLVLFFLMNLFLSPLQVQLPALAIKWIEDYPQGLGLLETIFGLGLILGGLQISRFPVNQHLLRSTYFYLFGLGFFYFVLQIQEHFLVASFCLLGMGYFLGLANVLILNLLQRIPKTSEIPQTMSLVNLISSATLPLSLAIVGLLQNSFHLNEICFVSGLGLLLITGLSSWPFRKSGMEYW